MTQYERMAADGWVRWSFVAAGREVVEDEVPRWIGELARGVDPGAVRDAIANKAA